MDILFYMLLHLNFSKLNNKNSFYLMKLYLIKIFYFNFIYLFLYFFNKEIYIKKIIKKINNYS